MSDLKVLSVASEIFPLVKTGGLADVVGALPGALAREGVEMQNARRPPIRRSWPSSPTLRRPRDYDDLFGAPARVHRRQGGRPRPLRHRRAASLRPAGQPLPRPRRARTGRTTRAASPRSARVGADIGLGAIDGFRPHVVHAHDWQAALAPAYLHYAGGPRPGHGGHHPQSRVSGPFPGLDLLASSACPPSALTIDGVEYFGGVGYLKAGLQLADRITTVSPTYAREIMTPEFGMALDGLLRARAAVVQGILNGIDDAVWNPATDPALAQNYSALRIDMRGAQQDGAAEPAGTGSRASDRPLFAVVSRLSDQKGLDLLLAALPGLVAKGGQFALLGSGDRSLEAGFAARRRRAARFGRLRLRLRREARPSLPGGRGFHRRAFALRALRPDAALRPALRRGADRLARRRPRRHGHRRQRGGDGRRRRDRRPVLPAVRRRAVIRARPGAGNISATRRRCGACRLNGMRADVSWRGPAQRYAALYRAIAEACRMSGAEAATSASSYRREASKPRSTCPTPRARPSACTTATAKFFARR